MWIWEQPEWPALRYDAAAMAVPLADAVHAIGRLHGRMATLQGGDRDRAALAGLMADVLQSSAIEGERLDVEAVRSSLARRLGVDGGARTDRQVDGVVEMTLDATRNAMAPLTAKRLQAWQAALFPRGAAACPKSIQGVGAMTPMGRCRWCPARSASNGSISKRRRRIASIRRWRASLNGAMRRASTIRY
jgi:hypothetical protein